MLEYAKLQIGCLIVVCYIAFVYFSESKRTKHKNKNYFYDLILIVTIATLIMDGGTAVMVNHLDTVPEWVLDFSHMLFYLCIDAFIFCIFLYLLEITEHLPEDRKGKIKLFLPYVVNVIAVVITVKDTEYIENPLSNYSMGLAAVACYVMAFAYVALSFVTFIRRKRYIERHKRAAILVYMLTLVFTCSYQIIVPESLVTGIAYTVIVIGMYVNQQNPALKELDHYHREMVMGFATLVEQRDDSTGGHIRRTSTYAELLAKELQSQGYYKDILTKDYIKNLILAAPMHDVGKISVPDDVLQKPGKLTNDEFEIMKSHAAHGGAIILDTFGNLDNGDYVDMAYEVAYYHHEKWNGMGYPEGIKGEDIPLCARIMAIVDVFDAVSEKRCYRDAMPLEQCFVIIEEGKGTHFDPTIADVFLSIRPKVEAIHRGA